MPNGNQVLKPSISKAMFTFILDIWSIVALSLLTLDFFSQNKFDSAASSVGIIYVALLGMYVGQKEFSRWHSHFVDRRLGEAFIIVWTVLMVTFTIIATLSGGAYRVPEEFATIYTSVIVIFVLSRHSKSLNIIHKK